MNPIIKLCLLHSMYVLFILILVNMLLINFIIFLVGQVSIPRTTLELNTEITENKNQSSNRTEVPPTTHSIGRFYAEKFIILKDLCIIKENVKFFRKNTILHASKHYSLDDLSRKLLFKANLEQKE